MVPPPNFTAHQGCHSILLTCHGQSAISCNSTLCKKVIFLPPCLESSAFPAHFLWLAKPGIESVQAIYIYSDSDTERLK